MPDHSLLSGDELVCPGVGAGRVEGLVEHDGSEHLLLRMSATDELRRFPIADAVAELRPPMDPASAAQHWAELTQPGRPDDRPWVRRYPDLVAALRGGRSDEQFAALRTLYSSTTPPSAGELRLIMVYEYALLSELALALGRPFDDLQAAARDAAPTFGATHP